MVSNSPSADVDWRPYQATGGMLVVAMALNAWTRNGLWFWYTALGVAGLLVFVGLARRGAFAFPTRAVWMFGLAGALHYLGGSLSGLHQIGGPNGLYYALPWWDNVVHAIGAGAMGIGAASLLVPRLGTHSMNIFVSTCIASTAGVLVELYEFSQYLLLGTVDQGFYTNTLIDLYNNLLGGVVGSWLYLRGLWGTDEDRSFRDSA